MKTNYKSIILSLGLALMGLFSFSGLFGQAVNTGDGAATIENYINSQGTSEIADTVTVNQSMPYWVWPSAAYNPDYTSSGFTASYPTAAEIATHVLSTFTWDAGTDGTIDAQTKNYVELSWSTTGQKTIQVTENPPTGLCSGDPVQMIVTVINPPTAGITNGITNELGLTNVIAKGCAGDATLSTAITFAQTNTFERAPYYVNATYKVYNVASLDASGNLPNDGGTPTSVFDPSTAYTTVSDISGAATIQLNGVNGTVPSESNPVKVTSATGNLFGNQTYGVENSRITVYEFTYNGVNGKISRKSDYLAAAAGTITSSTDWGNYSYYPDVTTPANKKYYIVVFPKPVTGPIYHIDNDTFK